MRSLLTTLLIAAMVCVGGTFVGNRPAAAADLDPADVPADAKWLIYVDFEQLLDGELAEQIREQRPQMVKAVRDWLSNRYGIDPQDELHSLTMFSRSYHSYTGTAILRADYNPEKIRARLREGESLKTTQWKDYTLYTVRLAKHDHHEHGSKDETAAGHDLSGGMQMTVVLLDDTLLFASSVENAESTLRLLDGENPSLEEGESALLAAANPEDVIYGAAIDLENVDKSNFPLPVLQQHERITWSIGNRDGRIYETALLVAQSPEVAEQMEQVLEGMIAFERLRALDSKPMNELLDNVSLSRDGKRVTVDWEGDVETTLAALQDLKPRWQQWKKILRE